MYETRKSYNSVKFILNPEIRFVIIMLFSLEVYLWKLNFIIRIDQLDEKKYISPSISEVYKD